MKEGVSLSARSVFAIQGRGLVGLGVGWSEKVRMYDTLSSKKSTGRSRARAKMGNRYFPTPTAAWLRGFG